MNIACLLLYLSVALSSALELSKDQAESCARLIEQQFTGASLPVRCIGNAPVIECSLTYEATSIIVFKAFDILSNPFFVSGDFEDFPVIFHLSNNLKFQNSVFGHLGDQPSLFDVFSDTDFFSVACCSNSKLRSAFLQTVSNYLNRNWNQTLLHQIPNAFLLPDHQDEYKDLDFSVLKTNSRNWDVYFHSIKYILKRGFETPIFNNFNILNDLNMQKPALCNGIEHSRSLVCSRLMLCSNFGGNYFVGIYGDDMWTPLMQKSRESIFMDPFENDGDYFIQHVRSNVVYNNAIGYLPQDSFYFVVLR